jgi:hypothetical protein
MGQDKQFNDGLRGKLLESWRLLLAFYWRYIALATDVAYVGSLTVLLLFNFVAVR